MTGVRGMRRILKATLGACMIYSVPIVRGIRLFLDLSFMGRLAKLFSVLKIKSIDLCRRGCSS